MIDDEYDDVLCVVQQTEDFFHPRECQIHVPTNHPHSKDHDLIDYPVVDKGYNTSYGRRRTTPNSLGLPGRKTRLGTPQGWLGRLPRRRSRPGAQLSARYSTRKSTGRRSDSRQSLQNTARSSLNATGRCTTCDTRLHRAAPERPVEVEDRPSLVVIPKGAKRHPKVDVC